MAVHFKTEYTCDHCYEKKEYEGEEIFEEIINDGWITVSSKEEKTYCSPECVAADHT